MRLIFPILALFMLSTAVQAALGTHGGLPSLPKEIPEPAADGKYYLPGPDGRPRLLTLDPELQRHLTEFMADRKVSAAAVVVLDIATGRILAMAQGLDPDKWGGKTHSALHTGFPAASVFKTIVTAATFELNDADAAAPIPLFGGCATVGTMGYWLSDEMRGRTNAITMRSAFGRSCNGFFAKIGVNDLGIGPVSQYASKFGFGTGIPADFQLEQSPIKIPTPETSSALTVGRWAAGFGYVGMSAVHAAWIMQTIGNEGLSMPVSIFADTPVVPKENLNEGSRIITQLTAERLQDIMDASVMGGTASFAFRRGKYAKIRTLVSGKTGTLNGQSPKGLTTWFAGLMPPRKPEIAVAAVAVLEDRWVVKGPQIAAEAFWAFHEAKNNNGKINSNSSVAQRPSKRKAGH